MDKVPTKQCHKCGLIKPITEFHNDKTKKDGKYGYCKSCQKKIKEIYHINNKDKIKASKQRWKSENPEKYHNSKARYHQEHKDIVYAFNKKGYEIIVTRPEVVELRNARKMYLDLIREFGLTPSSFAKTGAIMPSGKEEKENEFSDFG